VTIDPTQALPNIGNLCVLNTIIVDPIRPITFIVINTPIVMDVATHIKATDKAKAKVKLLIDETISAHLNDPTLMDVTQPKPRTSNNSITATFPFSTSSAATL
jgi:hypothetical protein